MLNGAPAESYAQSLDKHPKDASLGKKIRFFAPAVRRQADDASDWEGGGGARRMCGLGVVGVVGYGGCGWVWLGVVGLVGCGGWGWVW